MKRSLFALLLALVLVAAVVIVAAPNAKAAVDTVNSGESLAESIAEAGTTKILVLTRDYTEPVTLTGDLMLDLNGHDAVIECGEYTVYAFDSKTDFYADGVAGRLTASKVEAIDRNKVDKKRYLPIQVSEGVYELHRFYMAATEKFINPNLDGMGVVMNFCGSRAVKDALSAYGIQLCLDYNFDSNVITAPIGNGFITNTNEGYKRVVLTNVMSVEDLAEKDIYIRGYITTKSGETISSSIWCVNMQDMVEEADGAYADYTYEQKLALQKFAIRHETGVADWTLAALKPVATYAYSLGKGTINFAEFNKTAAGVKISRADGTVITTTVNGNVVTLSGDAVMNAAPSTATGASETLLVETANDVYQLKANVYSLAIRTADDFYSLSNYVDPSTKDITGYYFLVNDIDCSGKADFVSLCQRGAESKGGCGTYDTDGWLATFDGNNHIIRGLKNTGWFPGVFGQIGKTGVIKNVAFVDATSQGWGGFLAEEVYGTMENILITGTAVRADSGDNNYDCCTLFTGKIAKYATIKNITVIATANFGSNIYALNSDTVEDCLDGTTVVIGPDDAHLNRTYADAAALNAASTHMKAYANVAAATADATLTANGSVTFTRESGTFSVKWNGATVYSTEVINDATAYDYSLGNKTIDLSKIPELSGKTITGITHEDKTAIPYTASGNVITIGNDSEDILDAEKSTATGATTYVYVATADAKYKLPLNVYTLAIRTPEEFLTLPSYYDATTETQKGYFVLCNDLDFTGKANYVGAGYVTNSADWGKGFKGTFDGRNHIVKNLTIDKSSPCGVFGWIAGGSTVKDIAFVDLTNNGSGGGIIFASLSPCENVLVTGKMGGSNGGKSLFANILAWNYPYTKNITVIATEVLTLSHARVLTRWGTSFSQISGTVVAIGAGTEDKFASESFTTIQSITDANANIKPYLTAADAAAANLAANGSATFTTANGKFTVKWNGTTVYTEEVVNNDVVENIADAYDYSLGNKTLHFDDIAGVNAADVTAITHEDGTEIPYTVNGNIITLGDDTKDILDADASAATGAQAKIILVTPGVQYKLTLNMYTLAIRTPEEFLTIPNYYNADTKVHKGYFVLCNDLDFTGKANYVGAGFTGSATWAFGFIGTFDGRNHIVRNLTIDASSKLGLFGWIAGSGSNNIIKNVAFVDLTHNGQGGAIIHSSLCKVENVLVTGKFGGSDIGKSLFGNSLVYDKPGIKNITVIATEVPTLTHSRLISRWDTGLKQINGTVVAIGAGAENKFAPDAFPTIESIITANENIKPYLTATAAATDTTLTANGSVTFANVSGVYTVKWNGTTVYTADVIYDVADAYDYSLANKKIDFTHIAGLNAADITGITHTDGTAIPYTVSGNVITIGDDTKDVLDADAKSATGATTNVVLATANAKYNLSLSVWTLAIRTPEEFLTIPSYYDAATETQKGYFVLCNDLDFTGKANYVGAGYFSDTAAWGKGFIGIFDGRNHIVRNLTIDATSPCGVFGWVAGSGSNNVIKNVAFVDLTHNGAGGAIIYGSLCKVENVLVTGKMGGGTNSKALFGNNLVYNTPGIKNITVIATEVPAQTNHRVISRWNGFTQINGMFVAIGAGTENKFATDSYSTIASITAANANIKPYLTVDAAMADSTLTSNGSATFVRANGALSVLWDGKTVYGNEVVNDATAYDYALSDKIIDLTKIPELTDKTIYSITYADGTAIPYTKDGNIITVGDDTKNVLDAAPKSATGEIANLVVYAEDGKYELPMTVCTLAIRTPEELLSLKDYKDGNVTTGYFVLSNDIDMNGKIVSFWSDSSANASAGFCGTFDGQGHLIRNMTTVIPETAQVLGAGFFGTLGSTGTVKNVAFTNYTVGWCGGGLFSHVYGTVENVLVTGTKYNSDGSGKGSLFAYDMSDAAAKINNITVIATAKPTGYNSLLSGNSIAGLTNTANLVAFGADSANISYGNYTIETAKALNSNLKLYETVVDAANANLAACGSTSFTYANNVFNVKWNGTNVYGVEIAGDGTVVDIPQTAVEEALSRPTSLTITLYDAQNSVYGFTFNTVSEPKEPVIQIKKQGAASWTEYPLSYQRYTTLTTADAAYAYFVSKVQIDLEPNTTYIYRAYDKKAGVGTEEVTLETKDPTAESFTFINVTDTQGYPEYFGYALDASMDKAAFVLHTGDIVDASKYEDEWTGMLNGNFEYLSKLPLMALAGNHDSTFVSGPYELYKHFHNKIPTQNSTIRGYYYSFVYGDVKFIMLNTNDNTSDNKLKAEQYNWLVNELQTNTCKWTIVGLHNPMYSFGTYGTDYGYNDTALALQEQLNGIFAEYGVDIVLQGHDHCVSRTYPIDGNGVPQEENISVYNGVGYTVNPNGVVHIMSGAVAGGTRMPDTADASVYAYAARADKGSWAEFTVDGDRLTVTMKYHDGENEHVYYTWGIDKSANAEIIENIATAYDYSLGTNNITTGKTIDTSKIAELSGKTVTGLTHTDGTVISYTQNGNIISIGEDAVLGADPTTATGATVNVIVATNNGQYMLPLNVYTLAIRTEEEFLTFPEYFDTTANAQNGYYVLCNDLDFTGKASYERSNAGAASWGKGFCGVFDGRYHIVRNLTTGNANGVFGWIVGKAYGNRALVKNVAFVDVVHADGNSGFLGSVLGNVENVLVTGATVKAAYGTSLTFSSGNTSANGTKNLTVIATTTPARNYTLLNRYGDLNHITGTTVVIGAGNGTQISNTLDYTANTNIKPYLTAAEAAADTTLTKNGSATFETVNGVFTVKWEGTVVYTKSVS